MTNHIPRVSIGLPVYNGERFLAVAIDSILGQTYTDFELIISDNASTDQTAEICRQYAARDKRIRYYREETNQGGPWNFNRVFQYARGEFFKWQAADDLCAPTLIERSLEVLDGDKSAVLCYPRTVVIDGRGIVLAGAPGSWQAPGEGDDSDRRGLDSAQPAIRMRGILLDTVWCYELFGLVRREAMVRTNLHRNSSSAGKAFLIEMAFQGRFVEVPEVLFFNRRHSGQYTMLRSASEQRQFDAPRSKRSMLKLPHQIPCTLAYAGCIVRGPLSIWQRVRACGVLMRYVLQIGKLKRIARNSWRGTGMWDGTLRAQDGETRLDATSAKPIHSR